MRLSDAEDVDLLSWELRVAKSQTLERALILLLHYVTRELARRYPTTRSASNGVILQYYYTHSTVVRSVSQFRIFQMPNGAIHCETATTQVFAGSTRRIVRCQNRKEREMRSFDPLL